MAFPKSTNKAEENLTFVTPTWKTPGLSGHNLLSIITQLSPSAAGRSRSPTRDLYLQVQTKTHIQEK